MIATIPARRLGAALVLVVALAGLLIAPGIARAAGLDSVAMFSQSGDDIGGGQDYLWDSATGTIRLTDSGNAVAVDVSGGSDPSGDGFTFQFAAPSGQSLTDGTYANATRYPFQASTVPGLSVYGDGRGCNNDYGSFTIDDIGAGRLWLTFEQHCEGLSAPALFGEIRIGEPASTTPESAEPTQVNWPDTYTDTTGTTVPVTIVAGASGGEVTSLTVGGSDPADFSVAANTCTGAMLAAGGRCTADVTFTPRADGARPAELEIDDLSGATTTVPLTGDALAPDDSVTMVSQTGDWVGGGRDLLFDSATGTVNLSGTLSYAQVDVLGGNDPTGDGYTFNFAPPAGQELADGVYDNATRYPFEASTVPGLSVFGDGAGCNNDYGTFTIKDIGADASGNLDRLWLTYEQHCESASAPALFGEIRIGEPASTTPETAEPQSVDWPSTPSGTTGTTVPITIVAGPAGGDVSSLALTGADPSDFQLADGTCAGAVLAPAGRCQASVTFAPASQGVPSATLQIDDISGASSTVALSGTASAPPPPPPPPVLEPTTTILDASAPTSVFGTPVGYEAAVSAASGTPSGAIQYSIDGQPVGGGTPLESTGLAEGELVATLGVGDTVGAAYSGDPSFAASSATLSPTIEPAPTTLTLTSSANPASPGSELAITATVTDPTTGITPAGSVQFSVNGTPILSPEPLDDNGQAAITGQEPAGTYTISATYHDDADPVPYFVDSQGSLEQVVASPNVTTTTTRATATTSYTTATRITTSASPPATVSTSVSSIDVETTTAKASGPTAGFVVGTPVVDTKGRIVIPVESTQGGAFSAVASTHTDASREVIVGSGRVKDAARHTGRLVIVISPAARRGIAHGTSLRLRIVVSYRSLERREGVHDRPVGHRPRQAQARGDGRHSACRSRRAVSARRSVSWRHVTRTTR